MLSLIFVLEAMAVNSNGFEMLFVWAAEHTDQAQEYEHKLLFFLFWLLSPAKGYLFIEKIPLAIL